MNTSKVVTFYSYKGGSGRSMAMANVAWALSTNSKRVLVIDWDLEAPGLHRYFHPFLQDPSQTATDGLIDHVWRYVEGVSNPEKAATAREFVSADQLVQQLEFPFILNGCLHFIGAGRQDENYSDKVSGFDWSAFYGRFGGEIFINQIMEWARRQYDYILIDSRTGVADTAGICTTQVPDQIVLCFVYNRQSIEGIAAIARSITKSRSKKGMSDVKMHLLPSRVEDRSAIDSARIHCVNAFAKVPQLNYPTLGRDIRRSEIRHYPWCSFEEKLAVFEEIADEPSSLLTAMHNLAGRIAGKDLAQVEIDRGVLATYWRRAAFSDPRLAELQQLGASSRAEVTAQLISWLEEVRHGDAERLDWMSALSFSCVEHAISDDEIDPDSAEFLSSAGIKLADEAYARDPVGLKVSYAAALQMRSDYLKKVKRFEQALQAAEKSVDVLRTDRTAIGQWRYARAHERVAELTLAVKGNSEALPIYEKIVGIYEAVVPLKILPSSSNDLSRALRILAERYVDIGYLPAAFQTIERAVREIPKNALTRQRSVIEVVNVYALYADIAVSINPADGLQIIKRISDDVDRLKLPEGARAGLHKRLEIAKANALSKLGNKEKSMSILENLTDERNSLAANEATAALLVELGEWENANLTLMQIIRESGNPPSGQLVHLIAQTVKALKDTDLIIETILNAGSKLGKDEAVQLADAARSIMQMLRDDDKKVILAAIRILERAPFKSKDSKE